MAETSSSSSSEQQQRLDRADMSSVWKDGGNERFGMRLDLVQHLLQQRQEPQWVRCKQRSLEVLALDQSTSPVVVLELGCGLGMDVLDMAQQLSRSKHGGKVIGVDFNTQMINYARQSLAETTTPLQASNVTIEFIQADLTDLTMFADSSVDVIRSDITMQHVVNLDKALHEVARLLKPGGRFISLEATAGGFHCRDDFVSATYSRCMPKPLGTSVQLFFKLPDFGLPIQSMEAFAVATDGRALIRADPGWVKLKGMGAMLVQKSVLTQEEADSFQARYIAAAEKNEILTLGFLQLQVAVKS